MTSGFLGLVRNENMKIYRRPRTWIFAAITLLVVITVALVIQQVSPAVEGKQWRQMAQDQIQDNNNSLLNIADVPAPFRATAQEGLEQQNMKLHYHLDHNLNPYEKNSWSFVNGAAVEIVPLIIMFVIVIASDIVAGDFSSGSIKMLLIRPHHRFSILLSKYVAAGMYAVVMLFLLFAASWLIGNFVFGFGHFDYTNAVVSNGNVVEETASVNTLKIMGLEYISVIVLMSMTFMLAIIFRSNALAIGIGIFAGWVVSMDMVLAQVELTKYLFLTNLDLTYYLTNVEGKIEGTSFAFSITVAAVYWLVFMIVSWWTFQKRDVAT